VCGLFPVFCKLGDVASPLTNIGNMELFTTDNTTGYTVAELAAINAEWLKHCEQHDIIDDSPNYQQEAKWFSDRVAAMSCFPSGWTCLVARQ